MGETEILHGIVEDDVFLSPEQLAGLCGVDVEWLRRRVAEGLVTVSVGSAEVHFDCASLRRVRRLASIERDFDATPELAALVADLIDEVAALRQRLRRAGLE